MPVYETQRAMKEDFLEDILPHLRKFDGRMKI